MTTSPTPVQPNPSAESDDVQPAGRTRRGRTRAWMASAVIGLFAVGASMGTGLVLSADASNAPAPSTHQQRIVTGPPPVRLMSNWVDLLVHPFTSCWSDDDSGLCYDGRPPHPAPSLGEAAGPLTLAFPRNHWHFSVSVVDDNGHRTNLRLVHTSAQQWRLVVKPLAPGHYRADVFGNGPQGDVAATFAFTLR